jgi:hypothetical protein
MIAEQGTRVPRGGRCVVAGVWAAASVVHVCAVFLGVAAGPVGTAIAVALAGAGLTGAVVLAVGGRPVVLVVAAALGAVGVAGFLLPRLVALPGFGAVVGSWTDPWAFGGLLLDGLLVRLAAFTLRRTARATPSRPG